MNMQEGVFSLPTKKKPNRSLPKSELSVKDDRQAYAEMEAKLLRLNRELAETQGEIRQAPSREKRRALLDLEEAIIRLDQQIIAFLRERPELAAQVKRPDPLPSEEHLSESEWRERLRSQQALLEESLLGKQQAVFERREQDWHRSERLRLDEQERKLLNALADRQAKLEDEWQMRRKTETEAQALAWLRAQQKDIARQMQEGMLRIRQDLQMREAQWQQQTKRELAEMEKEWRKQRGAELNALEAAWREQEIMHRERAYLRRMEAEWRVEQATVLAELVDKWKVETQASQTAAASAWQRQMSEHLRADLVGQLEVMGRAWLSEQLASNQSAKLEVEQVLKQSRQELDLLVDRAARSVQMEYVRQHQQEIELLGQELRADLKTTLDTVATSLAAEHEKRLGNLAHDYKGTFASALERAEQALLSVHAEALSASHAEWLAKSRGELVHLCDTLREEYRTALRALAEEMRTEYQVALAQATEQETTVRRERDSELTRRLSAHAEGFLAEWQTSAGARLTALERHLSEQCREHLAEHESTVRSLHAEQLAKQHERWLALCMERLGAAKGELAEAFADVLSELKTGMLAEYTASLFALKDQVYVEYRGRLGRLADELAAKQRQKEPEPPKTPPVTRPRR